MYICICNAIREDDLRRVARQIPGDVEACYAALGKQPNCGACLEDADGLLCEERRSLFEPACAA